MTGGRNHHPKWCFSILTPKAPAHDQTRGSGTIPLHLQGIPLTLNLTLTVEKRRLNTLNQSQISDVYPLSAGTSEPIYNEQHPQRRLFGRLVYDFQGVNRDILPGTTHRNYFHLFLHLPCSRVAGWFCRRVPGRVSCHFWMEHYRGPDYPLWEPQQYRCWR